MISLAFARRWRACCSCPSAPGAGRAKRAASTGDVDAKTRAKRSSPRSTRATSSCCSSRSGCSASGIILGAIWADQSWGRPWGWDPKETFALVTWIVYLIVVHVRVATEDKAWWTAVLSVIGFFVMLFNWIGVNFFLVGLHSYA